MSIVKKDKTNFTEQAKIITSSNIDNKAMFYLAIKTDISKEKSYLEELERLLKLIN